MMNYNTSFVRRNITFLLPLFFTGNVIAQKLTSTSLFSIGNSKPLLNNSMLRRRTSLSISNKELNLIYFSRPSKLELQIPFEGKMLSLELERYYPLSRAFQVTVSTPAGKSEWYPYEDGLFFRGKIKNQTNSYASVSFFNEEVAAIMADEKSNIVLGAATQNGFVGNDYIMYRSTDEIVPFRINCLTDEGTNVPAPQQRPLQASTTSTIGCPVDVYVEADNALFVANGSNVIKTVNFVATVMNAVSLVYFNENISLQLREVKVWTTADPYVGTSDAKTVLKAFENNMRVGYNGDLAQLISSRKMNGGVNGIAPVDVLCKPDPGDRCSFVSSMNVSNPTSDINTYLVAHELGHNFGSLHSHNCSWVGGALDNCVAPEGTCAPGPAPANGGTIMSYCPVNLANGFGQQPGDKIRARLLASPCVCNCNNMEVSVQSGNVICASNGSATATVTGITSTAGYLWDNGETSSTAIKLTAGWHYVTVTTQNAPACKVIKGVKVAGTATPVPAKPVITLTNNILISSAPGGNQWLLNGVPIAGANSSSYQPQTAGKYTVQVTVNGCSSALSNDYDYLVQPSIDSEITVFPNPVTDNLTISNSRSRTLQIQLINMLGQTLFTTTSSVSTISLSFDRYTAGAYILSITDSNTNERIRKVLIK